MTAANNKTIETEASVSDFMDTIENEQKRDDTNYIIKMMEKATGDKPKMWGASIIGFGTYHYKYASGREGDFLRIGLSPRKQNIALYLICGVKREKEILDRIGKYKHGKSCFYINKLADVKEDVLAELIQSAIEKMDEKYPQ